jgi:hypothetical protein
MTTLQRLVGYPHAAVFDKAPAQLVVFRLRHDSGASWTIAETTMTARAGSVSSTYDLSALTVAQLATALADDGFTVSDLSSDFSALSALVLVEGDGDEGLSNGDRVYGYTSLMWVLMGGYAGVIREAGTQVVQALRQMVITQAEGEWLDLWGTLYNVQRGQGEADGAYAPRIPREAFRLRESPIAIEEAVKDATGKTIRIEEPWEDIFRLDVSTLSGPDKFQDGERVGYFFIQPTSTVPLDWSDVLPVIERNRAAGVLVLPPFSRSLTEVDANISGVVEFSASPVASRHTLYEDRALLDFSTIEETAIPNHPAIYRTEVRYVSQSHWNGWIEHYWYNEPWPDGPYRIESYYTPSYQIYQFEVFYDDQFWQDVGWEDEEWERYNARIGSAYFSS